MCFYYVMHLVWIADKGERQDVWLHAKLEHEFPECNAASHAPASPRYPTRLFTRIPKNKS